MVLFWIGRRIVPGDDLLKANNYLESSDSFTKVLQDIDWKNTVICDIMQKRIDGYTGGAY